MVFICRRIILPWNICRGRKVYISEKNLVVRKDHKIYISLEHKDLYDEKIQRRMRN